MNVLYEYATAVIVLDIRDSEAFEKVSGSYFNWNRKEFEDPDCTYVIYSQKDIWWDSCEEPIIAVTKFLETVRHAWILIDEGGNIHRDYRTDDQHGCDEVFEDILSTSTKVYLDHFGRHEIVETGDKPEAIRIFKVTAYLEDEGLSLIACAGAFTEKDAKEITRRWIEQFCENDQETAEIYEYRLFWFMTGATGCEAEAFSEYQVFDPFEEDVVLFPEVG